MTCPSRMPSADLSEKRDRLLDLGKIPRALAYDDSETHFSKQRHDDKIGNERDELFDCRIADALSKELCGFFMWEVWGILIETFT